MNREPPTPTTVDDEEVLSQSLHGDRRTSDDPYNLNDPDSKTKIHLVNWVLNLSPPVLSITGLCLTLYALVDFAAFVNDYNDLLDEVEGQSQMDFSFLFSMWLEIFELMVSNLNPTSQCQDAQNPLIGFGNLAAKLPEVFEATKRVTTGFLPVGPVWEEYLTERFPSQDGHDYGYFGNPLRFAFIVLFGVPNMEPLFAVYRASLFFDIISIVLLMLPVVLFWAWPELKNICSVDICMIGVDLVFFAVSLILLGLTISLSNSPNGYSVDKVTGRVSFIETATRNEHIVHGLNQSHWKHIPEKYCDKSQTSCFPHWAYQSDCIAASVNITVPEEFIVQDKTQGWFVDIGSSGTSIVENSLLTVLEPLFKSDESILEALNVIFDYQLTLTPEVVDLFLTSKNKLMTTVCSVDSQEMLWTDEQLRNVSFPLDSPDFLTVCNANCEWDLNPFSEVQNCRYRPCKVQNYDSCATNCPGVHTSCGCNNFNFGIWNYNCSENFAAITEENYNKFSSFAIENVQEGLKFDIAATVLDFVAICFIVASFAVNRKGSKAKSGNSDTSQGDSEHI